MSDSLVLGPLLRFTDQNSASIWVEVDRAATVTVRAFDRSWSARTFAVHGHHYALVELDGLAPATRSPYEVAIDDETVWPPAYDALPTPQIATLEPDKPLRLLFGSCRTSVSHDEEGNRTHGVDALRAYALRMAGETPGDPLRWPDLAVFLGDQVYADETTREMQEFITSRRDITQPPGEELKDYEEYAHLYKLAWSDPVNRWLLSTLPTSMIFDDHDVRDDWNTSWSWRQDIEKTAWWHGRIVAALSSYWVYQHLGNLSPSEREQDEIWRLVLDHEGPGEIDLTRALDAFADRVDQHPETYRWSYARDLPGCRLVMVDSRAARVLEPERRALLDDDELAWLDGQLQGDVGHLLIASSLPFLLAPGLHHLEAFSEALTGGAFGQAVTGPGEVLRRAVDLEHWAAFQRSFRAVADMVLEVARGQRGRAPHTVTFLGGDVHHSYVAEVDQVRANEPRLTSRIVQAVCSPIRNPLNVQMRFATAVLAYGVAGPVGRMASRSARVPDPPFRWSFVKGPWFDNNIAVLEDAGESLRLWWDTGVVVDGRHDRPHLERVATVEV